MSLLSAMMILDTKDKKDKSKTSCLASSFYYPFSDTKTKDKDKNCAVFLGCLFYLENGVKPLILGVGRKCLVFLAVFSPFTPQL